MSERKWSYLFFGLYAALGLGYSVLMPMWEAPDEQRHYLRALMVARKLDAVTIVPGVNGVPEGTQPPLYYWLAGGVLRLLDAVDTDLVDFSRPKQEVRGPWPSFAWNSRNYRFQLGPQLLRWLNIVLGGLALHLIYRAVRVIAPEARELALATVSLAGLTPQFLHISASVSNDPLANLIGALLFLWLSAICMQPTRPRGAALTAVAALSLPFLTKLTVLPMSVTVVLAIAVRARADLRSHWRPLLAAASISAAIIGVSITLVPTNDPVVRSVLSRLLYVRPNAFDHLRTSASHFVWSYWGIVGILTLGLPGVAVLLLNSIGGVGIAASLRLFLPEPDSAGRLQRLVVVSGLVLAVILAALVNSWIANLCVVTFLILLCRSFRRPYPVVPGTVTGWALVWIAVGLSILAIVMNFLSTPSNQGRYLFPAIGAISLLIVGGWSILLPEVRRVLPHLVIWPMTVLNLSFWFFEIVPFYFQPILD